jgi:hypothetical protein
VFDRGFLRVGSSRPRGEEGMTSVVFRGDVGPLGCVCVCVCVLVASLRLAVKAGNADLFCRLDWELLMLTSTEDVFVACGIDRILGG